MALDKNATPLIALDAYVVDTETTGLDPARARIVEIAAVPLSGGRLAEGAALRRLINPGEPIPSASTKIHRIDDRAVADAPGFAAAWPEFATALSGTILIGHRLGFDLAVLKRECARARLPWVTPRSLDTGLLAQVAEPNLGGYTIEHLISWLELDARVEARHSALGDAAITGRIFLALLPKLRARNIRTLAEAEQACLTLTHVLEDEHRAGWAEVVTSPSARAEGAMARIDAYPYRHRISDVMSAPVRFVAPDMPLAEVLTRMANEKISSLLVSADLQGPLRASDTGIVTERDVLRALSDHGGMALTQPVERFASKPLIVLPAQAFLYRALGRMSRLKLRHLGVEDDAGVVCGIVTSRDLLRLRAQEATMLGDALVLADDVASLGLAWAQLPQAAAALVAEGVSGRDVAAVISRELAGLTRRAGMLAEARMREEGQGEPPCDYALCVLGSGGRGESLLAMDQDNAIVFATGAPDGPEDRWFARFGAIVADILNEIGVPYCTGGVMGSNPQWRGSLATWRARIDHWVTRSSPDDVLSVDIFFDMIGVYGNYALANEVWRAGYTAARGKPAFAKLLAETAGEVKNYLNVFGGFRTENGRIDIKKAGLFGIVTTARVLAINHHLLVRSTPARLEAVAGLERGGGHDLEALARAQGMFLDLILAQQLRDVQSGRPLSNTVVVKRLTREQRERLRDSLGAVRHLDMLVRDLLF